MKGEKILFSSKNNDWETPQSLFNALNKEFSFTLDPCATKESAKCEKFFTEAENGLLQNWQGEIVFVNPPYGREIYSWVQKCYRESRKQGTTVVMLIPARTDTKYFHDFIYHKAKEIRFIKGRLKFSNSETAAPFPSMIVVF